MFNPIDWIFGNGTPKHIEPKTPRAPQPPKISPPPKAPVKSRITHDCPYCGYEITSDNVLFVNSDTGVAYTDLRKYCFLKLCASQWDLSKQFTDQVKAKGLYYRLEDAADPESVVYDEVSGLPKSMKVYPYTGKTPNELEREERERERPALTNFIQSYKNKHPDDNLVSRSQPVGGIAGFDPLTGAASEPAEEEEFKPLDDGTSRYLGERACPNCHGRLHTAFGSIGTINVTMLGGTSSGKTAYLVALVHQLVQLGPRDLGTATLLDSSQYYYQYLNDACQKAGGTPATPTGERLFPFVFYYLNDDTSCFICFYDIAGEETVNITDMLNHRGIMEADTLMLMIDPNQLNRGAYFRMLNGANGQNALLPEATGIGTSFNMQIDNYLTKAISQNLGSGVLQNVRHIVAVLTKIDMVLVCEHELFEGNYTLIKDDLNANSHLGGVDKGILDRIAAELNIFLGYKSRPGQHNGYSFAREVISRFPLEQRGQIQFDLLGVSVFTRKYAEDGSDRMCFETTWDENASKHRIIEPFLAVLAQNQVLNYRQSDF